jgi:hypothetical protein
MVPERPPCEKSCLDWDSSLLCLKSTHHNSSHLYLESGVPLFAGRRALSGECVDFELGAVGVPFFQAPLT